MMPESRFNLSRIAITNGPITVYFFIVLLLAGMASYFQLGQDEDPPFTFRAAAIRVFWPGADALQMSEQVVDPLEQLLQEVPYMNKIYGYTKPGEATVIVELHEYTSAEMVPEVWYQLRKKLSDNAGRFPPGTVGPFVNDEFGDVFGIIYAMSADGFTWAELENYADEVRKQLLRVPNVAKVEFYGKQTQKVYVEISQQRLSQLGINMQQVINELTQQNVVRSAGVLTTDTEDVQIRISGQFNALEELKNLPLRAGSFDYKLGDIAKIERGYSDPPDPKARFQGQDVIGIGISMAKGGNIITLGEDLAAHMQQIRDSLPVGIELEQIQDQPAVVKSSVDEFLTVLMEAVVIVLAVSFLSLGLHTNPLRVDSRPGLVVALSIPTVLAITFLIMKLWGIDLHKVSLGSLIIALGLMVDDAIIIIEMTVRKLEEGFDKLKATTFAYSATAMPMLTGTLITAVGFLPIGLANSTTGEYAFAIFGVTTAALVVSWLVSVYFVPYLGFHILQEKPLQEAEHRDVFDTPFYNKVRRTVDWCVRYRKTTILATIAAFFLGLMGFKFVDQQFFPDSNRPEILVDLWMPEGTNFRTMEALTHRVEERIEAIPGAGSISSFIGQGVPRFYLSLDQIFPQNNVAQIIVIPPTFEDRERVRKALPDILENEFPEARTRSRLLPNGPPIPYPIQFRVEGPEPDVVRSIGEQVTAIISADPDTVGVNNNWNEPVKTFQLDVDQSRARALGVTSQALADAGHSLLRGVEIGQYREHNKQIPIVLRQPAEERNTFSALGNAYMPTSRGEWVPIIQVARASLGWEEGVIWRRNRNYAMTVQSDVPLHAIKASTSVALRLQKQVDELNKTLPEGYDILIAGAVETSSTAQDSISAWMPFMLFLMFTLLMLQLRSFSRSLLVFLTGPLGIIGAVLALLILQRPVGFVAFLGIIAMNGMIIRNSLILVDQIEKDIAAGVDRWNAIVGAAVRRFRPIMLTAAAAVLAMIPLSRSVFWGPMAVAMMGGLIIATLLTLLSLPAMYAAWFRVKEEERETTA